MTVQLMFAVALLGATVNALLTIIVVVERAK